MISYTIYEEIKFMVMGRKDRPSSYWPQFLECDPYIVINWWSDFAGIAIFISRNSSDAVRAAMDDLRRISVEHGHTLNGDQIFEIFGGHSREILKPPLDLLIETWNKSDIDELLVEVYRHATDSDCPSVIVNSDPVRGSLLVTTADGTEITDTVVGRRLKRLMDESADGVISPEKIAGIFEGVPYRVIGPGGTAPPPPQGARP